MNKFTQQQVKQQSGLLETMICAGYHQNVAAKSATRIGVLKSTLEPTQALACFFVGKTCTHAFIAVWSSDLLGDNLQIMAVRVGDSSESPGSVVTGYANPARAATQLRLASLGGRENLNTTEDAIMASTPIIALPKIQVINGKPVTSSLAIADHFGKRHDNVIRNIQNIDCSPEFNALNFEAVKYHDGKGEERPAYNITRDGFTFLAMGFTGKRAAAFKEAYINAFNLMEEQLHQQEQVYIALPDQREFRFDARALVLTLNQLHNINLQQLYPMLLAVESPLAARIFNLINDSVFLAKKMKERADK